MVYLFVGENIFIHIISVIIINKHVVLMDCLYQHVLYYTHILHPHIMHNDFVLLKYSIKRLELIIFFKKDPTHEELGGFSLRREIDIQIQSKRELEPGWLGARSYLPWSHPTKGSLPYRGGDKGVKQGPGPL